MRMINVHSSYRQKGAVVPPATPIEMTDKELKALGRHAKQFVTEDAYKKLQQAKALLAELGPQIAELETELGQIGKVKPEMQVEKAG